MTGQANDTTIFISVPSQIDSQVESISHWAVNLTRYPLKAKGSVGPSCTLFPSKRPMQLKATSGLSVRTQKKLRDGWQGQSG